MKSFLLAFALFTGVASAAGPDEAAFLAENQAAMNKMMAAMQIQPTGDVDKDFVAMMAPHHQGAIDMAQAVLRYGRNEHGEPLPPSAPSPTTPKHRER